MKTKLYTKVNTILATFRKMLGTNKKTVSWPQSTLYLALCVITALRKASTGQHLDRDNLRNEGDMGAVGRGLLRGPESGRQSRGKINFCLTRIREHRKSERKGGK